MGKHSKESRTRGGKTMVKKYGIWHTIKYYHLLSLIVSGIIILLTNRWISQQICTAFGLSSGYFSTPVQIAFSALIWTIWGITVLIVIRSKSYAYLTGRSYHYDNQHFHRNYHELVNYFQNAEPHKLDTSYFPKLTWKQAKGLVFGMDINEERLIMIPSNSECNIAVFGPPGSGKTSGIAITNAITFQGSVLAIDIKGDLYNYVYKNSNRKIIRFAPDAEDALAISCHFDPLASLNTMTLTEQKLFLENMATILIPDEGGSEGAYFTSRARKLFQGITHLIIFENPNTSFPDIVHAILQGNVFDWVKKSLESDCVASKELLASFYGNNEKNVSGAYDALTTALIHFSNPILDCLLKNDKNCISIATLEKGYDVYLQISQEHLDAYAPLFTLIIQSFSTAFTKRPDSSTGIKQRPILMLMDEFPQLTFSYKMINMNLSTLRSKSVICMIIQQNLSQLEYRYQPAGARSIIGNCGFQIILGSNDIESSEIYSKTFGMKKILKVGNSITLSTQSSQGYSVQETEIHVFPPEYFGDLTSNQNLILYANGKYSELTRLNCYR